MLSRNEPPASVFRSEFRRCGFGMSLKGVTTIPEFSIGLQLPQWTFGGPTKAVSFLHPSAKHQPRLRRPGGLIPHSLFEASYSRAARIRAKKSVAAPAGTTRFAVESASYTQSFGSSFRKGEGWHGIACPYFFLARQ
jgi:hypothetical protein